MKNRWSRPFSLFVLLGLIFVYADHVAARLSFLSSFSAGQSYTSNLFFEEDNEEADWGTFLGPNLTLRFDNPDVVIGATYVGRFVLLFQNFDESRYIQTANILIDLPFLTKQYKGLTVNINETMVFTPQLNGFSLSGAEENGGNLGGRNSNQGTSSGNDPGGQGIFTTRANSFRNNAGITLGYAWTPRLGSSLGYQNRYLHFFSGGFQDSLVHTIPVSVNYRFTDQTSGGPGYSYQQTNFIGSSDNNTRGDKIISHNVTFGLNHTFTASIQGSIRGGVAFTKQEGATEEVEGPSGMTTTEDLSDEWRTRFIGAASVSKSYAQGAISLGVSQSIGDGAGLAAQKTRSRNARGRIVHNLSRRLSGFGLVGWAKNDSIDGDAIDTTTWRIQTGLNYTFTSWLFGNFSYSHINQSSSGSAGNDINVDQFFVGLTAVADPWVIMP